MNNPAKRLLIILALGVVGALGIYLLRQSYSMSTDDYQNAAPPVSAHATPDKQATPEQMKKRLDSLPKAGTGG